MIDYNEFLKAQWEERDYISFPHFPAFVANFWQYWDGVKDMAFYVNGKAAAWSGVAVSKSMHYGEVLDVVGTFILPEFRNNKNLLRKVSAFHLSVAERLGCKFISRTLHVSQGISKTITKEVKRG